ncbi:MAG TPA: SLC13 family permease [Gammaproteobacteria bacterium]
MFALLALIIVIFSTDVVRLDVGALFVLILLALSGLVPGLTPLLPPHRIFSGFSSNAVIAIIAVMILGEGMNKTGMLNKLASIILCYGGSSENRLTATIGATAGMISSFMQNTGAAALYIPVVSRIATRSGLPLNRLLLPMAFCAIVGGSLTMVGSSPLILLNDLLPSDIEPYGLFDVTPVGLSLLAAAIVYFLLFNRRILPAAGASNVPITVTADYLREVYGLIADINEVEVPSGSELAGMQIEDIEAGHAIRIIAAQIRNEDRVAPAKDAKIEPNTVIAVLGGQNALQRFVETYKLKLSNGLHVFAESLTPAQAGISEIVIPPNSDLIGKTIPELSMRKTYGLSVLNLSRGGENHFSDLRNVVLQAGDTLVCHSSWKNLARLIGDRNFVLITTEFPHEELRPHKVHIAVGFLALAVVMVVFTDLPLSVSLMSGALGMVLSGVLSMDEAYQSINWATVFLLAALIPLGLAVEYTGAANWLAQIILSSLGDFPTWGWLALIGTLSSLFSLVISNVGATVLLVPLVVNIALETGADPRLFALMAAICASNAFILPTHPVNTLIIGPGGYRVKDFIRAGTAMTILYLVVALGVLSLY